MVTLVTLLLGVGGWVGGSGWGVGMLGWSDEQDVHNYGNLGN